MAQIHCSRVRSSALHGMQQVSVGQNIIYFKKEIRGRNYEGLSISTDGNLCNGPSQETDYFVNSETIGKVFYKVVDNRLQIYSQNEFTPPQAGNFPVLIVQEYNSPIDYNEENAIKLGYTQLLLPDALLKTCHK
jgi:hypothetical protein